ncbi:MAG TPA: MarR family transcriptional regulator [Acidimicrobiia bacterium]|nr:MarR family transcriptional regulator [Acidimicrobiia bacterium]
MARIEEPAGVEVWRAFLRTHAAVLRRLERDLERAQNLPLAWYDVLLELNSAPGRRLRMQELSGRVVLSRSRVSRLVDDLVRAGLVRREPDPSDGRAAFAVITNAGRDALRRAAPVYLHGIEEQFLAHLTEDELRTIDAGLTRVLAAQRTVDERDREQEPARGR